MFKMWNKKHKLFGVLLLLLFYFINDNNSLLLLDTYNKAN